ncbi:hypothetical protein CEXT_119831 [Caerostris extrusa]|uniref:Uncharacterized protein n=1 Tax=Caerostris extrusa TaxID=172846 RepID=A0AAV4U539_CAEEX|nr:hypothetical protein CEXT_119831 [Caerostris extrusa]
MWVFAPGGVLARLGRGVGGGEGWILNPKPSSGPYIVKLMAKMRRGVQKCRPGFKGFWRVGSINLRGLRLSRPSTPLIEPDNRHALAPLQCHLLIFRTGVTHAKMRTSSFSLLGKLYQLI